jgi:MFS family permease
MATTEQGTPPETGRRPADERVARPRQDWRLLLAVFFVTSLVEGLGVSQIYAFMPSYLSQMGVPEAQRLTFVGVFGSLIFIVGAPLVPLWGVWADKYSRKAVIVRSALVEAVVLAGVALSREPWQLALSMLGIGLQLGNTGVMLAEIRDVTPRRRLGRAIATFGASSPIGFAVGPVLGGIIVDDLHLGLPAVFAFSSLLSLGTALLVTFGSREVRPEVVPEGRVIHLAFGAVRFVLRDRTVRRIFATFFAAFLASQISRSYVPILVEGVVPPGGELASAIGLVSGVAALTGALVSPVGGVIGDRVGFRPVLVGALVGGGLALFSMALAGTLGTLALAALLFAAMNATVSAMVFGLLATEVPPDRRSATLNLAYLPLYAAGIVGPFLGAIVSRSFGLDAPFLVGGSVLLAGATVTVVAGRRAPGVAPDRPRDPRPSERGRR